MKKIVLALLLLCQFNLFAQQLIQGIIKNAETNQPIEHVIVTANHSAKNTVTNSEGRFQLNTTSSDTKIILKHIDFFTKELAIQSTTIFRVEMQPASDYLEEIVILHTPIRNEIEKAIKTSQNRFSNNLKLNTFYRELLYINDDMYQYEDAEVDYYLQSINKSNIIVKESRSIKFNNPAAKNFDSLSRVEYYWGDIKERVSNEFDFALIKNIIANKEYELYLTTKTAGDGTNLYILNFFPIDNAKKATLSGTIAYGSDDYLIREIKVNLAEKFIANNEFVQQNNHNFKRSFYNRTTIFSLYNNKYALTYTSYRIYGVSKVLNQLTKVGGFVELLVDSIEENPAQPNKDQFYFREKLTPLGKNYKTKYWKKFNVVPLTFKEEQMLKLINE